MNSYELISPITNKPCGVFVCGVCNKVTPKDLVEQCCQPCQCGKPTSKRLWHKCGDCIDRERFERFDKLLQDAELVEWDGVSMIFSEEFSGHKDGWFASPEDLIESSASYLDEEFDDIPEFAFVGKKVTRTIELSSIVERLTEDTHEDYELNIAPDDWADLQSAVDRFNAKYAVTYYEHDYKKKVRVKGSVESSGKTEG